MTEKFPDTVSETKLTCEQKLEAICEVIECAGPFDEDEADHQIHYHSDTLTEEYKRVMKMLHRIHNITCMSVEEVDLFFSKWEDAVDKSKETT